METCVRPGHENDLVSAAYCSDLSQIIAKSEPSLWIYGHTHMSDDRIVGNTRILLNAKGYGSLGSDKPTWDNPLFDPLLTVEI
jgi:hypothetical protein